MKRIDLADPFEKILARLSSLPLTDSRPSQRTNEVFKTTKVKRLLREIYEAANGRQVATTIGPVPIAPPIAPHLKDKPFCVNTQADFLLQALARIADGLPNRMAEPSGTHLAMSPDASNCSQAPVPSATKLELVTISHT